MSLTGALVVVLISSAVVITGAIVWVAVVTVKTMRSVDELAVQMREKGLPLVEKTDVMVDAASVELLRIDNVITRFEEASVRVSAASGTLSEIVQAPADMVNGVAERVRRAWNDRKHSSAHETSDTQEVVATPLDETDQHD